MTCSSCRYEFCWLCLADYNKHYEQTGRYLCNSYADVQASNQKRGTSIKKGASDKMEDAIQIERELKRLEFFTNRYYAQK